MKFLVILKKEYKDVVKKKSFIISTILTPLLMAVFIFVPGVLMKVAKSKKTITIADYSGFVYEGMRKSALNSELIEIQRVDQSGQLPRDIIKSYEKKILEKETDALLYIPAEVKKNRKVFYYSMNVSDIDTNKYLSSTLKSIIAKQILVEKNVLPDIIEEATREIRLETFKVKKEGTKKSSFSIEYMVSILMMTILFSVIMTYGTLLMRNIIQEKNNRIMEVLISSTSPRTLFYGKIMGLAMAGLTQVGIWILLAVIFLGKFSFGLNLAMADILTLEFSLYFVIYFILGYFMYSILFSIVGASVNTDEEAQQYAAPVIYVLIIPFIIGLLVTKAPNNPIVILLSLIPLFSPTLMFMRISVVMPPFYQILISIVLSIFTILFLAWLGAKIFRTGILMYGKKPSIKEIIKWIKYK